MIAILHWGKEPEQMQYMTLLPPVESFATFCFIVGTTERKPCVQSEYFASFQSMHKSVLSSREEEPFNLNPEMKSFIPS